MKSTNAGLCYLFINQNFKHKSVIDIPTLIYQDFINAPIVWFLL